MWVDSRYIGFTLDCFSWAFPVCSDITICCPKKKMNFEWPNIFIDSILDEETIMLLSLTFKKYLRFL